jgi:hypothetical protein
MGLWHPDCNDPDCDSCRELAYEYVIARLHAMVGWALLARAVDVAAQMGIDEDPIQGWLVK